jgi:hypothetical protein
MKFRKLRIAWLALCGIVLALVAVVAWYVLRGNPIDRVFGSRANAAIVSQASRVEAYRLGPLPKQINWQNALPADYPIIGGPVLLAPAIAADVSNALTSPKSYLWDAVKGCIPTYGVKFSFFRDADRMDVLLCFECDILWVSRDGRAVGGEDFDNSRALLVRAAKTAFPDDALIQKLQEDRHVR